MALGDESRAASMETTELDVHSRKWVVGAKQGLGARNL